MENKNIIIGSDHAGVDLKDIIKNYLAEEGYEVKDIGVYTKDSADYPVIAKQAANETVQNNVKAILICGTGIGMSIAANKVKGVRAVVCSDTTSAKLSRQHNNANVLCFGARIIGESLAKDICKIWLETEFQGERHQRRVNMIED